ncbi:oocyte zinc finger protein XlCOF6-like isoform X2 [Cloeon dipterum]|uniref:oocyte zinc finger protein XlCOF6-like isoform X2 n=1 Tax=Cloeon dipterum TaxID=197152 RepID=UPI0032209B8D
MQPPRVKEGKILIQKPLCRLCECPTSDGHVLAWQVDRFKLRKWAMKIMNLTEEDENLPDVVGEDALICYFCIWQAEFGDESGDEAVAWWPKNLELEENAKVLRENYSVGEVEQCWVQLEEVDLAKYTKQSPKKRKFVSGVCIYCGNRLNDLRQHIRLMHKEAIKCGVRGCASYFHTEEEKEQHMQQNLHGEYNKSRESREIYSEECKKVTLLPSVESWSWKLNRNQPELPVACTHFGCNEYFKSKSEMILHVNSSHKQAINQDLLQCKHCEFFTTKQYELRKHEEARHLPKIFKCGSCDAKFGSKRRVNSHYKSYHTFDKCKSCVQDVVHGYISQHRKPSVCSYCKKRFKCLGLYRTHRKSCRQNGRKCKDCGQLFTSGWKLRDHMRLVHSKKSKVEIFFCSHCDFCSFRKDSFRVHILSIHLPKTVKCAECNNLFAAESLLKIHKYKSHEDVRCSECNVELCRASMFKHRAVKTCPRCNCKFKCSELFANHLESCQN